MKKSLLLVNRVVKIEYLDYCLSNEKFYGNSPVNVCL